jgi:hypothetical protein
MIGELLKRIDIQLVVAILGAVFTILGLFTSELGKLLPGRNVLRWIIGRQTPPEVPATIQPPAAVDGVLARLAEAKDVLRQQYALAKTHRLSGGSLTFGQFIVGGLLASSFVQDQTSKTLIGVLGLLVLASSIIRQHYKPESSSIAARERAVKLKAVIREVEDQLYFQKEGVAGAVPLPELRIALTRALNDLDAAETLALAKVPPPPSQRPPGSAEGSR